MSYGIIYKVTNNVNGKIYVGQTIRDLHQRVNEHFYTAAREKDTSPFYRAIRKYGRENFIWESVCECFSQEDLDEKERLIATKFDAWVPNGYNIRAGFGKGSMSKAERERRSGQGNPMYGRSGDKAPAYGRVGDKHPMFGKTHSKESVQKIIDANSKTYEFLSPEGIFTTIYNMNQFCRENPELTPSSMLNVYKGKKRHHKGWIKSGSIRHKNTYYFINPLGETVEIHNLKKFCREHPDKLDSSAMMRVYRKEQTNHKGWKCLYNHSSYLISKKFGAEQSEETINKKMEKVAKEYCLVSPQGVPTYIKNMSSFCRESENGLGSSAMISVYLGRKPSYKGWTRYKGEDS